MGPTCFDTVTRAREFLLANIAVSDDCSSEVRLDVEHDAGMSKPGLLSFNVTATDVRCEGNPGIGVHSHMEIFQIKKFDGYKTQGVSGLSPDDTIARGMGCDRADQNCECLTWLVSAEYNLVQLATRSIALFTLLLFA